MVEGALLPNFDKLTEADSSKIEYSDAKEDDR